MEYDRQQDEEEGVGYSMVPKRKRGPLGECCMSLRLRFWYGCFGVFFGFSIFAYFLFVPKPNNLAAALWGLGSGIYALFFIAIIHWRQRRGDQEVYVNSNWAYLFYIVGIAGTLGGLAAMVVYIIVAAQNHESANEQSDWVTSVWAFMTAKWALGYTLNLRPLFKVD